MGKVEWGFVAFIIFMAVVGLFGSVINTKQVCKTQDVFWVKGTQYSCKWFK